LSIKTKLHQNVVCSKRDVDMEEDLTPLSEATSPEEFKTLREAHRKAAAEPAAEKTPQAEEAIPVIVSEPGTEKPIQQESPADKPVDEQIKELRAKGKHAAANKLMVESATKAERDRADGLTKELEALRRRPAESRTVAAKTEPAPVKAVAAPDVEPKVTDEKYAGANGYQEFVIDAALWKFKAESRTQQEQQKQQESQTAITSRVNKVLEEGKKAKPDFDAVVGKVIINVGVIQEGVQRLDNFGDVLYAIGSDPALLSSLQAMNPMDQWAELRYLSRTLGKPAAPAALKPAVSRVAAPPRVLSGTEAPEPKSTSEAVDYNDFKRIRKLQRAS
jgi:hypothetical protein